MNQTMIYDYLGFETDPMYLKLKQLKKGQRTSLGSLTILLNNSGLYEVVTDDLHDAFINIKECYKFLKNVFGDNQC
ncbi:hypothetical protein [Paucisalibacillus globulus]|uniref:hypothetical protein n=1 Tax=Paucisalibacillus globulus TaxID=351095 RepID=UPI00047D7309|nr:hypothetical protein [Paucisalibacillus globulus]